MRQARMIRALSLALLLMPAVAAAAEWESEWKNRLTLGAQLRTEQRDPALVGKANLDPQLCAEDD
ncbi:MAG TPA: DUF1302 family protein, partial [Solimonas sp.]|nr:DUF1302 family protein [Solimonas sp.]